MNYLLLGLVLCAIGVFAWFEISRSIAMPSDFGLSLLKRRLKH